MLQDLEADGRNINTVLKILVPATRIRRTLSPLVSERQWASKSVDTQKFVHGSGDRRNPPKA
jgi:hypothetical protein